MLGIDFAWGGPIAPATLHGAGVSFVARYLSPDPTKNLALSELHSYLAADIDVVLDWEYAANAALNGYDQGVSDAKAADAQAKALGLDGAPIYFSVDFDATQAQQTAINEYFQGVASVIGLDRTGVYGGFYVVQRVLNAKLAAYAWQTYAWSGGQWDTRACIRQTQNNIWLGGVNGDWDTSMTADFGQMPRPSDPTLGFGDNGPEVYEAQMLLAVFGYEIPVDGGFGQATLSAVNAFQLSQGIQVTGQIGVWTWGALRKPKTFPNLKEGATGADVKTLQTRLNVWSSGLTVDGDFGPKTEAAVLRFQGGLKLTVDGEVGPNTWAALFYTPVK